MKTLNPEQAGICWRCTEIKYIDKWQYQCRECQHNTFGTEEAEHCFWANFTAGTDLIEAIEQYKKEM